MTQKIRPKLLYYTDCPFFAGCENMLSNFFSSPDLLQQFDMMFSYRHSKQYESDIAQRIATSTIKITPTKGLYTFRLFYTIKNAFLKKLLLTLEAFVLKYPLFLYNIILLSFHFRAQKADILHINNGGYPAAYSCNAAAIAAKLCGIKNIVYVVNNLALSYAHPSRWLDYPIDFFVKKCVRHFITGSQFAGKCLADTLTLKSTHAITINNGINLRVIHSQKQDFLKQLNLHENQVVAAVVARLEKRKGHIYLLEAMKHLKSQGKTLPLVLIEGIGPEKNALEQFVKDNGLNTEVVFLTVPHIFDLINAVDFTILPSIAQEDFPNVTLESMSLGKPVIGSSIAGIPEQIENDHTGILVPPKGIKELAHAISRLTEDVQLRLFLGQNAKEKFFTQFTQHVAVKKYIRLYESMLGEA